MSDNTLTQKHPTGDGILQEAGKGLTFVRLSLGSNNLMRTLAIAPEREGKGQSIRRDGCNNRGGVAWRNKGENPSLVEQNRKLHPRR